MASFLEGLLAQKQPQLATHQALLVIGLQNDFISPNGKLFVTSGLDFVEQIRQLVPAFREWAGDIIWVQTHFRQDDATFDRTEDANKVLLDIESAEEGTSAEASEDEVIIKELTSSSAKTLKSSRSMRALNLLKRVSARKQAEGKKKSKGPTASSSKEPIEDDELFLSRTGKRAPCCLAGTPGADFPDRVLETIDKSRDTVLSKPGYSAFTDTSLLTQLRTRFITELYICGCMTNLSVYATALDAARYGLTINIIEDCLGYRKASRHEEALKQLTEILGAYSVNSVDMLTDLASAPEEVEEDKEGSRDNVLAKLVGKMKVSDNPTAELSESTSSVGKDELKSLRGSASAMDIRSATRAQREAEFQRKVIEETEGTEPQLEDLGSLPSSRTAQPEAKHSYVKQKARMRQRSSKSNKPQQESVAATSSSLPESSRSRLQPRSRSESRHTERSASTRSPALLQPESSQSSQDVPRQQGSMSEATTKGESTQIIPPKAAPSPERSVAATSERSPSERPTRMGRKQQSLATFPTMGPGDSIGEGDSYIIHNFLPLSLKYQNHPDMPMSDHIFHALYNEVRWQKMYHAQGEVPRLVAVQGDIGSDGSMPVYRHPSDQAPPLLHFSPFVQIVRQHVQEVVKHPVNHVLIQLYRSGQDFISEHSDKTLDIVRESSIVNVSFGAQRTMRLRTKRSAKGEKEPAASRTTQRIPMPHNSIFVLGQNSNMRWLHGINADKRPAEERSDAEKAYSGTRISLTFRHIGTFLSADNTMIWGQGATVKDRKSARKVVNNNAKRTEDMIVAFGSENHSTEFDWKGTYGKGFDVLHFRQPPDDLPILFPSNNSIENKQVSLFITHLGLKHIVSDPPPADYRHTNEGGDAGNESGSKNPGKGKEVAINNNLVTSRAVAFRDADKLHTEVAGALPILLYLHRFYHSQKARHDRPSTARTYELIRLVETLTMTWNTINTYDEEAVSRRSSLVERDYYSPLERVLGDVLLALGSKEYLHGEGLGVADCAAAPVLGDIIVYWEGWDERRWEALVRYHDRMKG